MATWRAHRLDAIPGSVLFLLAWAAFPLALGMILPVMLVSIEISMAALALSCLLSLGAAIKASSHRLDARVNPPYPHVLISLILITVIWWSPIVILFAIFSSIICFHAAFRVCDHVHRTSRDVKILAWDRKDSIPVELLQKSGWSVITGNWFAGLMATHEQGSLVGVIIEGQEMLLSTAGVISVIEEE